MLCLRFTTSLRVSPAQRTLQGVAHVTGGTKEAFAGSGGHLRGQDVCRLCRAGTQTRRNVPSGLRSGGRRTAHVTAAADTGRQGRLENLPEPVPALRRALTDRRSTQPCLGRRPQPGPRRQGAATPSDRSPRASTGKGWPSSGQWQPASPEWAEPGRPRRPRRTPCPLREPHAAPGPPELTRLDGDGLLISRGHLGDILEGGSVLAREAGPSGERPSPSTARRAPTARRSPPGSRPPLRPTSRGTKHSVR